MDKTEKYKDLCINYVKLYNNDCENTRNIKYHCDVLKNIIDECFTFKARKMEMYTKEKGICN